MNRKGVGSALSIVVKIIVILIVFIVLISTFIGLFGRTKKATLDLIKKEHDQFIYLDGSYIHPDLLDSDLSTFWFIGFKSFIREAITSKQPCLGSFYIDDRIDMQGVSISFLQEPTGITMFLRDSKGVVGAYDDITFNNTDGHEWKLCIIDPSKTNFNAFFHEFELSFKSGQPLHDVVIDFKGKPKGSDIKATYFTPERRDQPDVSPEEVDYHAYIIGRSRSFIFDILAKDKIDRYLFFFVVSGDNFCILPTTREKNTNAFNIKSFQVLLKDQAKKNPNDVDNINTLCKVPGGEESEERSIFKGHKSCYYYGCQDIGDINVDLCNSVFGKCKGVCSLYKPHGSKKCMSCKEIKKCKDYEGKTLDFGVDLEIKSEICTNNLCDLGCNYIGKECVST